MLLNFFIAKEEDKTFFLERKFFWLYGFCFLQCGCRSVVHPPKLMSLQNVSALVWSFLVKEISGELILKAAYAAVHPTVLLCCCRQRGITELCQRLWYTNTPWQTLTHGLDFVNVVIETSYSGSFDWTF